MTEAKKYVLIYLQKEAYASDNGFKEKFMIYVTSDIHGKFECLKKLLESAGFSDKDWLFIIGDVIDRNGDGGVELLKWLLVQPNVQLILGNHENFLLSNRWLFEEINDESVEDFDKDNLARLSSWQSNGGDVTINSLSAETAETRQDILDYLDDCPLFETVSVNGRKYVLVHGGLGNFSKQRVSLTTPRVSFSGRVRRFIPNTPPMNTPLLSVTRLPWRIRRNTKTV